MVLCRDNEGTSDPARGVALLCQDLSGLAWRLVFKIPCPPILCHDTLYMQVSYHSSLVSTTAILAFSHATSVLDTDSPSYPWTISGLIYGVRM